MRFLITALLCIHSAFCLCQPEKDAKRDHVWLSGYFNSPPNFGGSRIDFVSLPPLVSSFTQEINLAESVSIMCDTYGELLFYSNYFYIADRNYQIMPNGDSINPGFEYTCWAYTGFTMPRMAIFLRLPESENIYYLLHEFCDTSHTYIELIKGLYYSIIDMNLNNGLGDVVQKNLRIIKDTLHTGIAVTRHANGRDWWILVQEFRTPAYYIYLLSPDGIQLHNRQFIGTSENRSWRAIPCFSPNGSRLVITGLQKHPIYAYTDSVLEVIKMYDFDRCSGELSNFKEYIKSAKSTTYLFCNSISPNSRYLYITNGFLVFQYDLDVQDFWTTKQIVAEYDGYWDTLCGPGLPIFEYNQLAHDNKIYFNASFTKYMHAIEHPDLPGTACQVVQRKIVLPTYNQSSTPYYPNFRLGRLIGSPCDTLYNTGVPEHSASAFTQLNIFPNPTNGVLTIEYKNSDPAQYYNIHIADATGRELKNITIPKSRNNIKVDVSDLKEGVYMALLLLKNEIIASKKMVILR